MLLVKLLDLPRCSDSACTVTSHPIAESHCSAQRDLGWLLVQISDAGADVLLDALVMDCSMVLLDLSANQLTMKRCDLYPSMFRKLPLLSRRDQGTACESLFAQPSFRMPMSLTVH